MIEAFSNKDKCLISVNDDNDSCSYCVIEGSTSGLCVDPAVAEQMEQINPKVSCATSSSITTSTSTSTKVNPPEEEDDLMDVPLSSSSYRDFKCTIKAFNDPNKCSHIKTDDKSEYCEYCTMDGPFGKQGICVSPEHAAYLEQLGGDQVSCDDDLPSSTTVVVESTDDGEGAVVEEKEELKIGSDVMNCSLSGIDMESCLDPSKTKGSDCIWCEPGTTSGLCFPSSWESTASRYLTCHDHVVEVEGIDVALV